MLVSGFNDFFEQHEGQEMGPLRSVWCIRRSNELTADDILSQEDLELLVLIFEHATLTLRAVGEDDTIEITEGSRPSWPNEHRADISRNFPWSTLIGKELRWAWSLTNNRGYPDALQLELAPPGEDGQSRVRLLVEVAASRFRLYVVSPAHMNDAQ